MGATLNDGREPQGHPEWWMAAGAVITLMESAGMVATVAVGLSMYDCAINTSNDIMWEMMRLYYFSHERCNPYRVGATNYNIGGVNKAANRTVIFMSIYTVLYSLWFIGSILLLVSATKGKKMKPKLGRNLQYVWVIPTGCIIILDVIATVLYCVDIMSTADFESVMGLLNIKNEWNEELEGNLSEPPKRMALLASKGGLLWVINVVFLIILLVQFKKMFLLRTQEQFVQAHLSTMPSYLWPPKLLEKNLPLSKNAPTPTPPPPTIPRLINQDGLGIVAAPQYSGSMGGPRRTSALQIAARQGFSYERPNSGAHNSPTNAAPLYPPMSPLQDGVPQENLENWYSRQASMPPRENERPSNILQRDNDVFY